MCTAEAPRLSPVSLSLAFFWHSATRSASDSAIISNLEMPRIMLQGRMDDVEMEVEDKELPRKAMGARMTGHAANQRRAVMRGEPAFDGSQRASSWAPPDQVKPGPEADDHGCMASTECVLFLWGLCLVTLACWP